MEILFLNKIEKYDILCAGFPCQGFSSAGLKKGLKDCRSNVYIKILEIIEKTNPKIVLLENVKNLLVLEKGKIFEKICKDLSNLNYSLSYELLNTKNFALAQNRERVFILCLNNEVYNNQKLF